MNLKLLLLNMCLITTVCLSCATDGNSQCRRMSCLDRNGETIEVKCRLERVNDSLTYFIYVDGYNKLAKKTADMVYITDLSQNKTALVCATIYEEDGKMKFAITTEPGRMGFPKDGRERHTTYLDGTPAMIQDVNLSISPPRKLKEKYFINAKGARREDMILYVRHLSIRSMQEFTDFEKCYEQMIGVR